jgi:Sulfotransferase family
LTKVLYILGRGRGGSTVLANVLGEAPGVFAAGEVRTLWDPVLPNDSPCACGQPVRDCEVWSKVLESLDDIDPGRALSLQHEVVREPKVWRLLRKNPRPWPALEELSEITGRLYRAIADETGARTIVDSSKRPAYAAFLMNVPEVELFAVHLVRDPRASAHSWETRRYASVREGEVKRRNAIDSTIRWDLLNVSSEAVLRRAGPDKAMRLRYEDFVAEPQLWVTAIGKMVGEVDLASAFVDESTVELGPNHTIAGNPSRYRTGRMALHDPAEWRTEQNARSRWAATLVALPLLRRYGYPFLADGKASPTRPRT